MGQNWQIYEMRRHLLFVQRDIGYGHCFTITTVDIAAVDFEAYANMALAMDYAR